MDPLNRPGLLTAKDLAAYLQVSRAAISQWCKAGHLPFFQVGKCIRFDPVLIKEWLDGQKKPAASKLGSPEERAR